MGVGFSVWLSEIRRETKRIPGIVVQPPSAVSSGLLLVLWSAEGSGGGWPLSCLLFLCAPWCPLWLKGFAVAFVIPSPQSRGPQRAVFACWGGKAGEESAVAVAL